MLHKSVRENGSKMIGKFRALVNENYKSNNNAYLGPILRVIQTEKEED